MVIHNPSSYVISALLEKSNQYRCMIDGSVEFCGMRLPVGTEREVLDWIKAKYCVLGELFVFDREYNYGTAYVNSCASPWLRSSSEHPTKRYLVKVGDAEKVLVLLPFPDRLLEWNVKGVVEMKEAR